MMQVLVRTPMITICASLLLLLTGCEHHLAFVEENHWGLKAEMSGDSATPANVDIGFRRSAVAFIPQTNNSNSDGAGNSENNELTSFYSSYEANIGFGDPIYVNHFLATGEAAVKLMVDEEALEKLRDVLVESDTSKPSTEVNGANP